MTKGLDGIRTPRRLATAPTAPVTASRRRTSSKNITTPVAILVVALVGIGTYFYYLSLGTPEIAVSPETVITAAIESDTKNTTGSPLTNNVTTVNIYDSGAGSDATTEAISKLETAGYTTQNLANSQLQYDKTYVWYRPEFEDEAKKIAAVLDDREVVTSRIHITGSFDLLIYLGKK